MGTEAIPTIIATQHEDIICPACNQTTQATAVLYEGAPWWAYVHVCECGYMIMESEWEPAPPQEETSP